MYCHGQKTSQTIRWFKGNKELKSKSEAKEWSDLFPVTIQLILKMHKDGVPVIGQVEHPVITRNLQTHLEVQHKPPVHIQMTHHLQALTQKGECT